MEEAKQTLIDMIIGIVFCDVLFMIPGFFWKGNRIYFIAGLILGAVAAVLAAVNMYHTIDKCLDLQEKSTVSYSKKTTVIRLLLMAVLLVLGMVFLGNAAAFGIFLGIFCLKFSAYIQPLTHKYITNKFFSKGR